jgi:hypothetical protein
VGYIKVSLFQQGTMMHPTRFHSAMPPPFAALLKNTPDATIGLSADYAAWAAGRSKRPAKSGASPPGSLATC